MPSFDGCRGCGCPKGMCYWWQKGRSECWDFKRKDGLNVIFHQVPIFWDDKVMERIKNYGI